MAATSFVLSFDYLRLRQCIHKLFSMPLHPYGYIPLCPGRNQRLQTSGVVYRPAASDAVIPRRQKTVPHQVVDFCTVACGHTHATPIQSPSK